MPRSAPSPSCSRPTVRRQLHDGRDARVQHDRQDPLEHRDRRVEPRRRRRTRLGDSDFDTEATSPAVTYTVLEPKTAITKSVVAATPAPGDVFTYSVTASNPGGANVSDAHNVVVEDVVPVGVDVDTDTITGGGAYDSDSRTITWDVEVLDRLGRGQHDDLHLQREARRKLDPRRHRADQHRAGDRVREPAGRRSRVRRPDDDREGHPRVPARHDRQAGRRQRRLLRRRPAELRDHRDQRRRLAGLRRSPSRTCCPRTGRSTPRRSRSAMLRPRRWRRRATTRAIRRPSRGTGSRRQVWRSARPSSSPTPRHRWLVHWTMPALAPTRRTPTPPQSPPRTQPALVPAVPAAITVARHRPRRASTPPTCRSTRRSTRTTPRRWRVVQLEDRGPATTASDPAVGPIVVTDQIPDGIVDFSITGTWLGLLGGRRRPIPAPGPAHSRPTRTLPCSPRPAPIRSDLPAGTDIVNTASVAASTYDPEREQRRRTKSPWCRRRSPTCRSSRS